MIKELGEKELNRRRKIRLAIVDYFGIKITDSLSSHLFKELVANKCTTDTCRAIKSNLESY